MESPCPYCGALVESGVEGCILLFHDLCSRGYSNPAYSEMLFFIVDAHALQHPELHGKKNNAFHLLRLCWLIEYGGSPRLGCGPRWLENHFSGDYATPVLATPANRGNITVADLARAKGVAEYRDIAGAWGYSVWNAYYQHHTWARDELNNIRTLHLMHK